MMDCSDDQTHNVPDQPGWATSLADARVGESVYVSNGQGGRHSTVLVMQIAKRGRTLLTVGEGHAARTFRMSDGKDSKHTATTPGPPSYIYTESERLRRDRMRRANEVITEHGIAFRLGCQWSDADAIALADWLDCNHEPVS